MPTVVAALLLGILQGMTEFLPISSSGHLVLAQYFLGVSFPGITFEIVVHFGTLLAIIGVFWGDIKGIMVAFLKGTGYLIRGKRPCFSDEEQLAWRFAWLIIIGTFPTAALGIFLAPVFERLFGSVTLVGLMLLATGTILWCIERGRGTGRKGIGEMGILDAIFIGFAQGLAIIPGLSRSGATIAGALFRGLNRDTAMRYSFLLALPAITGATVFKLGDITTAAGAQLGFAEYGLGLVAAAVTGVIAIKTLFRTLKRGRLFIFGYYCWAVGLLTLSICLIS